MASHKGGLGAFVQTKPKKPKKKVLTIDEEFKDDPKEIQALLQEVKSAKVKDDLYILINDYKLDMSKSARKDVMISALYDAIRSGKKKQLSYLKKKGISKWKYTCRCKFSMIVRSSKDLSDVKEKCKKCGKDMKVTRIE